MTATPDSVLALDVGAKRIGVAIASSAARLPRPLTTLDAEAEGLFETLKQLAQEHQAASLVVGLPRGLSGQQTAQTAVAKEFAQQAGEYTGLPIYLQDEAVTSRQAEAELEQRGKPYTRGDIDALAATYILEDWLANQTEGAN